MIPAFYWLIYSGVVLTCYTGLIVLYSVLDTDDPITPNDAAVLGMLSVFWPIVLCALIVAMPFALIYQIVQWQQGRQK